MVVNVQQSGLDLSIRSAIYGRSSNLLMSALADDTTKHARRLASAATYTGERQGRRWFNTRDTGTFNTLTRGTTMSGQNSIRGQTSQTSQYKNSACA